MGRPSTKVAVDCENCGTEVMKKPSDLAKSNHHFCSYPCRVEWLHKQKKPVECEQCGKEFTTNQNRDRKYCSRDCFNKAHGYENFDDIDCICDECGTEFTRKQHELHGEKTYCSQKCQFASRKGKGNPNYQPDRSKLKTPQNKRLRNSTLMEEWRDIVYKRDDYTCALCGKRGGNLNAHHIKRVADRPDLAYNPDNGVTLCEQPCHKSTYQREQEFEALFTNHVTSV